MQMTMPRSGELIGSGRAFVAEQWGFIVSVLIVWLAVDSLIAETLRTTTSAFPEDSLPDIFLSIAQTLLSAFLSLGSTKIYLDIIDGKAAKFSDIISQGKIFVQYIIASILFGIAVCIGALLLIVPGIYIALKYGLYIYVMVDRPELSAVDALKESARLTDGIKWNLFWFGLALLGINLLGALALGIGLLYTIPVSSMATVALYRSLTRIASGSIESPIPPVEPVAPPSTETPSVA